MPGVILDAGQLLDEARDAGQRPEIRAKAVRPGALPQGRFDLGHLLGTQSRLAPGPPCGAQRRASTLAPRLIPPHDALATDAQPSGDGAVRLLADGEEPRGVSSTNFQSMEIPSWGSVCAHASIVRREAACVSLYYARLSKDLH